MKIDKPEVNRVVAANDYLGESPLWSTAEQSLYWINCQPAARLQQWQPLGSKYQSWDMPQRIGAVAFGEGGCLLIALADGLYHFSTQTAAMTLIAHAPHADKVFLHEGKCDRQGRFWIGSLGQRMMSHGEKGGGFFYRLDGNQLTPIIDNISVANGLAWSPKGDVMYFTDTPENTVWQCRYDVNNGEITDRKVFVSNVGPGLFDGAAVDSDGCYWVTMYGGGRLHRYTPDGNLDRVIELPLSRPTMVAFGGAEMKTLYVTSTQHGEAQAEYAMEAECGGVFTIEGLAQGIEEARFNPNS